MANDDERHALVRLETLTPRQVEVLKRIAQQKTNFQIADELGIGYESVKTHVSDLLGRLGVDSREEAAALWRSKPGPSNAWRRVPIGLAVLSPLKVASVAVLTLLAAAGVVFAVAATRGGAPSGTTSPGATATIVASTASGVPVIPGVPPPPVAVLDDETALAWIEAHPMFRAVVGSASYEVVVATATSGEGRGRAFFLQFDEPLDSNGPWVSSSCRGTRLQQYSQQTSGIRLLGTGIEPDGTLVYLEARSEADDAGAIVQSPLREGPLTGVSVREMPSGKQIWKGDLPADPSDFSVDLVFYQRAMICPEGMHDD